ncbi:hypothetical protein ACTXT7_011226 [Hymenolepis weldensis]
MYESQMVYGEKLPVYTGSATTRHLQVDSTSITIGNHRMTRSTAIHRMLRKLTNHVLPHPMIGSICSGQSLSRQTQYQIDSHKTQSINGLFCLVTRLVLSG